MKMKSFRSAVVVGAVAAVSMLGWGCKSSHTAGTGAGDQTQGAGETGTTGGGT